MSENEHHLQRVVVAADTFVRRYHRYIRDPGQRLRGAFNDIEAPDPAESETALAVVASELADALRTASDLDVSYLPVKARRGLRDLTNVFRTLINRWGWREWLDSEPAGREAYMAERLERFHELVAKYRVCLISWRRPAGDDDLPPEDDLVQSGRKLYPVSGDGLGSTE